jgi:hypothetical protein
VSSLELCLQIFVYLEGLSHLIINKELIRNGQWNQELGSVSLSLQLWKFGNNPIQNVLDGSLFTMHNVSLEIGVEVRRVS